MTGPSTTTVVRSRPAGNGPAGARRRGMTVLIVMAIISITLAMSYAIMRSQITGVQLQMNSTRGNQARQAALTGLNAAMRSMRLSSWPGVGATLTGTLTTTDSYSVTFAAGDPQLVSGMANYSDYWTRVTITSTGTSLDPAHPGVNSTYRVQAVMRLVPRQTSPNPSNWSTLTSYTVYQMTGGDVTLSVPVHLDGPVRLQGKIDVAKAYSWSSTVRQRYYSDLLLMKNGVNEIQTITRSGVIGGTFSVSFNGATTIDLPYNVSASTLQNALQSLSTIGSGNVTVTSGGTGIWNVAFQNQLGAQDVPLLAVNTLNVLGIGFSFASAVTTPGQATIGDYRPFSGPVFVPTANTDSTNMTLLTTQMALTMNNISTASTTSPPTNVPLTYRMYPGGPQYNLGTVPNSASNVTLGPNPATNPLGIFYASSSVSLGSNVTITGMLVTGGDVTVTGTNVKLLPVSLPALDGTSLPIRPPTLITLGNLRLSDGGNIAITGTTFIGQKLLVDQGTELSGLSVTGNMIVGADLSVAERNQWRSYGTTQWDTYYNTFVAQLGVPSAKPCFPQWLYAYAGRNYLPLINFQQDTTAVTRTWPDLNNPLYMIASGDNGLRWDLVRWTDHP